MAQERVSKVAEIAKAAQASLLGDGETVINGLAHDSRLVKPGDLFICIVGEDFDGHSFAADAVENGAVAILAQKELPLPVPQLIAADTRVAMGLAAACFYDYPSHRLRVVGVTGTKGKTTTTYLVKHLLQAKGERAGLIGTTGLVIDDDVDTTPYTTTTTPESLDIQRFLSRMVEAGCKSAVMEVTSHASVLQRTAGTEYDVAVFTNIAPDHLDYHPTFADYLKAKSSFFTHAGQGGVKERKAAVVNIDDAHARAFINATKAAVITIGVEKQADLRGTEIVIGDNGVQFKVTGKFGSGAVKMKLTGRFNVYNTLCAMAVALHEGLTLETCIQALEEAPGVPGRFERVSAGQGFEVIVDYAHTGPSLQNVLQLAREVAKGRIITVFGAGGNRDPARRVEMGRAAGELADYVIVTSDNPRWEEPEAICDQIVAGLREVETPAEKYEVVVDRRAAIRKAVRMAVKGDLLLIAGKGHETYQETSGKKRHFDDRQEAYQALMDREENHGPVDN